MSAKSSDAEKLRLTLSIEELRRIRSCTSVPFFAQPAWHEGASSRVERISLERKRLYGTGWRKLKSRHHSKDQTDSILNKDALNETAVVSTLTSPHSPQFVLDTVNKPSTADHENNSSALILSPSIEQKPVIYRTTSDRTGESQKLQATVKLLSESLEEIGSLRALLECSMNPNVLDRLLQSSIFESAGILSHAEGGENVTAGMRGAHSPTPNSAHEMKFRALLLEQSRLIDQVRSGLFPSSFMIVPYFASGL